MHIVLLISFRLVSLIAYKNVDIGEFREVWVMENNISENHVFDIVIVILKI